jgi:hypothetical protein
VTIRFSPYMWRSSKQERYSLRKLAPHFRISLEVFRSLRCFSACSVSITDMSFVVCLKKHLWYAFEAPRVLSRYTHISRWDVEQVTTWPAVSLIHLRLALSCLATVPPCRIGDGGSSALRLEINLACTHRTSYGQSSCGAHTTPPVSGTVQTILEGEDSG